MKLSKNLVALMSASAMILNTGSYAFANGAPAPQLKQSTPNAKTSTPIKHLVVIFQENVSFDHYFATYPTATNPKGEPKFFGANNTPGVNNLVSANLLTNNPNFTNSANGAGAANPFRLDRTQAASADQNHNYTPEQQSEDNGAMDLFPKYTGTASAGGVGAFGTTGQVMGYYDGNTVTGLWNYAQRFAMSDSARTDGFGPSTPGALEVISGQLDGAAPVKGSSGLGSYYVADGQNGFTDIGDVDPAGDVCSSTSSTITMNGPNIGNLLNAAGVTWGGFMGGFDLSITNPNGTTGCARSTTSAITETDKADYVPHHMWFQYYQSTANYTHARPSSVEAIGYTFTTDGKKLDPANHQYDTDDFFKAVRKGNFPAVSYLKAPAYQDGHPGYSDPLDEQAFVVKVINFLQAQKDWASTAVIVTYDDSDGWYDHSYATPTSASFTSADQLNGNGVCGTGTPPNGLSGKPVQGRCGPGLRIPFMVISPYAKENYVSHTAITQASVVQFIEDNWLGGERLGGGSFDATTGSIDDMFNFTQPDPTRLYLNPRSGEVTN